MRSRMYWVGIIFSLKRIAFSGCILHENWMMERKGYIP
jgi:hypothetical protein